MSKQVLSIADASFDQLVLQQSVPVLVVFGGKHCAPCVAMEPSLDQLALEYNGRVVIGKIDADEAIETATQYGVRGLPLLMLFNQGEPTATHAGAVSKAKLAGLLDKWLADND